MKNICDNINATIKNILTQEISSDINIELKHSSMYNRMCKISNCKYIIETDLENFNENIFLHECMHISQFERGFPKLSISNNCSVQLAKIAMILQDFVLDVYVNSRLKNKYNFQIKQHNNKYIGYKNQIDNISRQDLTINLIKLIAIETAYIYFNNDKALAQKLITKIERKLTKEITIVYKHVISIMNKYFEESPNNCTSCFNELISLLEISDVVSLDYTHL